MVRRFYASEDELQSILAGLKQQPCPQCKVVGALIRYGYLRGYDEDDERQRSTRARRVFCNNRKANKNGCGKTFSIWAVDKIRRLSLGTQNLWKFLKGVSDDGNKLQALRQLKCSISDSAPYRIWKRFEGAQSSLRTALGALCQAPVIKSDRPEDQVVAHLEAAFPDHTCPISAFQQTLQVFFL
jgi:hypothetical protein